MKHLFISFLLPFFLFGFVSLSLSAHPDDRNTIYVYVNSLETPKKFSLSDLNKITFTNHSMKMHEALKVTELEFSTFSFMSLDANITPTTDIRSLSVGDDANISYYLKGNSIVVESDCRLYGIRIYDLQGRLVVSEKQAANSYNLSLANTPRGVFVVQVSCNGKMLSRKMVK